MDHIEVFRYVGYPSQCDCTDTGGHYCKKYCNFCGCELCGEANQSDNCDECAVCEMEYK
jgi:hypothetical protein